jgi:predicted DNA binding CopG/RHH family protein
MTNKKDKKIDPLPDEFASLEEAAEFWDTHDTTDYPEAFEDVEMEVELKTRHYEVEVEADLFALLREEAKKNGVPVKRLVSELLRKQLPPAA